MGENTNNTQKLTDIFNFHLILSRGIKFWTRYKPVNGSCTGSSLATVEK